MRYAGHAGGLHRRQFAANRFSLWPYGPFGYGSPYRALAYQGAYGPFGYGGAFGSPVYGGGFGPLAYGSPFGMYGYGWFGNVWPDMGWPDSGSQVGNVQYITPPPPEPAPPQVIAISADWRGQTAPEALPDFSYVAGCKAIPNGYHCASGEGAH